MCKDSKLYENNHYKTLFLEFFLHFWRGIDTFAQNYAMKKYDFDTVIERRGTGALKYDALEAFFGKSNLTPLWVADMDFYTPQFITDAIKSRLEHSLFGYAVEPEAYKEAICKWIYSHHNWEISRDWITYIPGIVKGIGYVINRFVGTDEKIIIQPPVYHPFRNVAEGNGRQVVLNPLKMGADGSYSMDFDNLEKVADSSCRLLILANPHNPIGIVWDRQTLERLADFCYERDIIVISDEIHSDMALFGHKHIPFASVSSRAASCSITFGAPSKTFNIAGIVSSYAIVPDSGLRSKFFDWLTVNEFNAPTMFATIATTAAFTHGEEWQKEMIEYIEGNIEYTINYCKEHIPQIKALCPQASFLVWLDCRDLGLEHTELVSLFEDKAHLALNSGAMFGEEGRGFMRLNIALPRAELAKALKSLKIAVENR